MAIAIPSGKFIKRLIIKVIVPQPIPYISLPKRFLGLVIKFVAIINIYCFLSVNSDYIINK